MEVNLKDVTRLIPQAAPFVMVDELLTYTSETLTSGFTVKASNIFTDNDRFAESGLIENMAQTVALHTGYQYMIAKKTPPVGYLGAINKVIINRLPKLNEHLETRIAIVQEFNGVTLVDIEVYCENEQIAIGQMKTVIAS